MNIETINAMRAELEQFHAIVAANHRLAVTDRIDVENRVGGYVVYYDGMRIQNFADSSAEPAPFPSMSNALAWLRSEAGVVAVKAAEAKGGRRG